MNIVQTRHKVFLILGEASASSPSNNNDNIKGNNPIVSVDGAVIMTVVIARVHLIPVKNTDSISQLAADHQGKPAHLSPAGGCC